MYYYPVPKAKANSGGDLSIRDTRSHVSLARDLPIERDLAYIASLGPGPKPWERPPGRTPGVPTRPNMPPHA